jgi:hypothetical protein
MFKPFDWTETDELYLRKYRSKMTPNQIAKVLNANIYQIKSHLVELSLSDKQYSISLPNEIWKKINGFDYAVSNFGRVKCLTDDCYGRDLKSWISSSHGYIQIILVKDGQKINKRVHRLVAEAFIVNPNNKDQVNHKDGDKTNNHLDNLEWMNQSENQLHAFENGLQIGKRTHSKVDENLVHKICKLIENDIDNKTIIKQLELDTYLSSPRSLLSRIKLKREWTTISKNYNF